MKPQKLLLFLGCLFVFNTQLSAQAYVDALPVPDTLAGDTIHLSIDSSSFVFYNGGPAYPTFCYNNAGYLGPTLIWNRGSRQNIEVTNHLGTSTTVHWHGAHVPAKMDGGPHQGIAGNGGMWPVEFDILDRTATMWYHPHKHMQTTAHVQMGLAGFILIRDANDPVASMLPRTYGVDDFHIVLQDRSFSGDTIHTFFDSCLLGDSIILNGKLSPFVNVPAQMVRFRLLNGSSDRSYMVAFNENEAASAANDIPFKIIATDAGYYAEPYDMDSIMIVNGERYEILLDLGARQGDTIYMVNKAGSLPLDVPGGPTGFPVVPPDCIISEFDTTSYPIMRIIVGPPTGTGVTVAPAVLDLEPKPTNPIARQRTKALIKDISFPIPFLIDSVPFDHGFINDTIMLGDVEEWTITNNSQVAHPWHIHDTHFWITSIDGDTAIPPQYRGPKDVMPVLDQQEVVYVAEFLDFGTAVPDTHQTYMEHCHILTHEDGGMMHQFAVIDPMAGVEVEAGEIAWTVFPNPSQGQLSIHGKSPKASTVKLYDLQGRLVWEQELPAFNGNRRLKRMDGLTEGLYILQWNRTDGTWYRKVILD